ncbi:MAG: HEAT repeat domain-containing protein [Thermoguttaceae bacterium]|nr:HEAT repeat domain-containing protein [Thermoguttaceae bacterium]MDW8077555.1 HEAT repeat domain-containing protein [Thermoguttaceae bacterium]
MTSRSFRRFGPRVAAAILATVSIWVCHAEQTSTEKEVAQLVAILRSDAPYMEKLRACKRIRQLGAPAAVPALGELLFADENLSHAARIALEAIPDPVAGRVLVDALPKLDGSRRIGAIQSLGVRRETEAVSALVPLLGSADPETAAAAAEALGNIASEEATSALMGALNEASPTVRPAVARALIKAAEILQEESKQEAALKILDFVSSSPVPDHIRLAAKRAAILADRTNWSSRLAELLRGDAGAFAVGLEVARSLPPVEVAKQVIPIVDKTPAKRKALLLELLGDLGIKDVLPTVIQCAQSEDITLQVAAMKALGKIGDASVFPLLFTAALSGESQLSAVARESLATLPDPVVNEKIVSALNAADEASEEAKLLILIELAGRRRIAEAAGPLKRLIDWPEQRVRHTAIVALAHVIEPSDLSVLTTRLIRPQKAEDRPVLQEAIRVVTVRAVDRERVARVLTTCLQEAPAELHPFVIEMLGLTASDTALKVMSRWVWDSRYQDLITRILGQWMGSGAAPILLEVAEKAEDPRFRLRALRGYLRIARQFDVPAGHRLWMYAQSLRLAERDEERQLAQEGLLRMAKSMGVPLPEFSHQAMATGDRAVSLALVVAENLSDIDPVKRREAVQILAQIATNPELKARAQALAAKLENH